ncbi:unnamed protein product [Phytophthora fragariaefolia]|uniref:Unnamed protein product n=1 Tax=Phytophthora fragariaefolia TaxID=1490495 RepID=A0A9W6XK43_9STRA|nr:unnamed protein product [Phytophthora fragariaefolia]
MSRACFASMLRRTHAPQNATLYVLNNHRFPKWLYSYDSSVTRTQREMTHHLVVYVFQLTGARSQQGDVEAAVLARHESPGFALISYRRSGNNSSDAGCDLPAVEIAADSNFAAVEVDLVSSRSNNMEMDIYDRELSRERFPTSENRTFTVGQSPSQVFGNMWIQQQHIIKQQQPKQCQLEHLPTSFMLAGLRKWDRNDGANDFQHRSETDAVDDKYLWQKEAGVREPAFREKAQHLLILWHFIQRVSLSDLEVSANAVKAYLHPHWLSAAVLLRSPSTTISGDLERVVALFLSNIFNIRTTQASVFADINTQSIRDQTTVRTTVHLFLRALSSCTIQRLLREACLVGDGASNKQWLQERFVSLMLDLYDILDDLLHEVSERGSTGKAGVQPSLIPAHVDNVLSLIYGRTHFSALRDKISALFLDRQTPNALSDALNNAFNILAAQAHETMLLSHQQQPQHWGGIADGDTSLSRWSNRWLLDPGSLHFNALVNEAKRDASGALDLVAVAQLIREFGCVTVEAERNSLSLRTAVSFGGAMVMAPMELVLDGCLRGFDVLPSGISTKIATTGGWSIGDYQAKPSDNNQCLNLHFFAFKESTEAHIPSDAPEVASPGKSAGTVVHRISLSLILKHDQGADESTNPAYPRDVFAVLQGTICDSKYTRPSSGVELSSMSSADRSVVWNALKWARLCEVQAGYVAI